jgi:putative nucleotidyltransferase with HDIG domain
VAEYAASLEEAIRESARELNDAKGEVRGLLTSTIQALVSTLEAKDKYTEGHSWNVAHTSVEIARELGLGPGDVENLLLAATLHDIGKIGIQESILNKPAALSPSEYDHIRTHPETAVRILRPINPLAHIISFVRHHHEWFDGGGYPDGIRGDEIPLGARIIAVADAYHAMTSDRAYREAKSPAEALEELRRFRDIQFDADVVDTFVRVIERSEPMARVGTGR